MKARILAAMLLGAAPAFAHGGIVETSTHDKASFATAAATFKLTFEHDSDHQRDAYDGRQQTDRHQF